MRSYVRLGLHMEIFLSLLEGGPAVTLIDFVIVSTIAIL